MHTRTPDTRLLASQIVEGLRGITGVTLPPPASARALFDAERALGLLLPECFGALAAASDGITLQHGQLQFLSLGGDDVMNIARFNDPATWQFTHAPLRSHAREFLYAAVRSDGRLIGWRRSDIERGLDCPLYEVRPADPTYLLALGYDLVQLLEAITADTRHIRRTLLAGAEAAAVHRRLGPLPRGQMLMPGPQHLLGYEISASTMTAMPVDYALRSLGDLIAQIEAEPDGVLYSVTPWVDEHGRSRLRYEIRDS